MIKNLLLQLVIVVTGWSVKVHADYDNNWEIFEANTDKYERGIIATRFPEYRQILSQYRMMDYNSPNPENLRPIANIDWAKAKDRKARKFKTRFNDAVAKYNADVKVKKIPHLLADRFIVIEIGGGNAAGVALYDIKAGQPLSISLVSEAGVQYFNNNRMLVVNPPDYLFYGNEEQGYLQPEWAKPRYYVVSDEGAFVQVWPEEMGSIYDFTLINLPCKNKDPEAKDLLTISKTSYFRYIPEGRGIYSNPFGAITDCRVVYGPNGPSSADPGTFKCVLEGGELTLSMPNSHSNDVTAVVEVKLNSEQMTHKEFVCNLKGI